MTIAQVVLSELNIYPIKSAAGISLQTAEVEWKGLRGDRRWMVVNDQGKFMTQRQFPAMALIAVALEADQLTITAPAMEPLVVAVQDTTPTLEVEVWGDRCQAISAGDAAREWFSQFLQTPCQLVYLPDGSVRPVNADYAVDPSRDQVSFADAFPFLLISEASLQDLNDRLQTPLPMNRFRPNFVVRGCDAFAEDGWRRIRIGSVLFHVVKSCSRCAITTVDQTTGIKGNEPLQTLATYRLQQGHIMFGQNLLQAHLGSVSVGDAVEILDD
jgi:uncharacterized protein